MAVKPNNNRIEDVDSLSQLDFGGVIKDVHSFPGHYLRVRDALTVVKQHYDYLTTTYNVNDLPTQVKYWVGLTHHETKVSAQSDVAGSLNNKYFFIYEGRSDRKFHVWYNVNGAGVDPAPSNSTGIEIAINTNDAASIVAYATELVLNSTDYKEYFTAKRAGTILYIGANKSGVTTDSLDVDTGFTILNQQGTSQLVQTVVIEYDGTDPLFDGQVLKGYYYNIYSGSFEKGIDLDAAQDNVAISDGTDVLAINADGSINVGNTVTVQATDLDIRDLAFATDKVDVSGSSVTVSATDLDIRDLTHVSDSIKIGDGTDFLAVNADGSINVKIEEPLITTIQGTEDGNPASTPFYLVYNKRAQILDSHDRIANFIYADFGTKNQRIIQIDYTSATFPGTIIRRVFNYTLVGNNYRRDNEIWSEI